MITDDPNIEIMVYQSRSYKHIFIKRDIEPGNFIRAETFSDSMYLETGAFAEQRYLASCCRKATKEEIEEYKKIVRDSKRGKFILQNKLSFIN